MKLTKERPIKEAQLYKCKKPFLKEMKYTEESSDKVEQYLPIKAGKYAVSVQANKVLFCAPRGDNVSLTDISGFEVALFDENDKWFHPRDIPGCPGASFWNAREDIEGKRHSIFLGGYVPIQTVQEIIDFLREIP